MKTPQVKKLAAPAFSPAVARFSLNFKDKLCSQTVLGGDRGGSFDDLGQ
jgi:hypothetical protein